MNVMNCKLTIQTGAKTKIIEGSKRKNEWIKKEQQRLKGKIYIPSQND